MGKEKKIKPEVKTGDAEKLSNIFGPGTKRVTDWEDDVSINVDDDLNITDVTKEFKDADNNIKLNPNKGLGSGDEGVDSLNTSETESTSPYSIKPRGIFSRYNDVKSKGGTLAYKYGEMLNKEMDGLRGEDPIVKNIHVDVVDRGNPNIPNAGVLMYSAVVTSVIVNNFIFHYTLVIQDSKIKEVLTFDAYNKMRTDRISPNKPFGYNEQDGIKEYTPDRCLDGVYFDVISNFLLNKYGKGDGEVTEISGGGAVVYNESNVTDKQIEETCSEVALIVYNVIRNAVIRELNPEMDLTLPSRDNPEYTLHGNSSNFVLSSTANRENGKYTVANLNGLPVRSDFTVTLDFVEKQLRNPKYGNTEYDGSYTPFNQAGTLNTGDLTQRLTMVHGYIDPIVIRLQNIKEQRVGDRVIRRSFDIVPNVVLTNISLNNTTLGYTLLAIISSFGIINADKLVGVMNIHSKANNVGALNIYCDLLNESPTTNQLKPLSLYPKGQKNATVEDYATAYNSAQLLFNSDVVLSIDVPNGAFETAYTKQLSAASIVDAAGIKRGMELLARDIGKSNDLYDDLCIKSAVAGCEIIKTAHALTNGKFPLEFPPENIFVGRHILIPNGYYMDKSEARDIREVDLPYVINESGVNIEMINNWSLCSNGRMPNNVASFDVKADIISKLLPSAYFTGISARCTFTNEFLTALFHAVINTGFTPRESSTIQTPRSNIVNMFNGGVTSGYYDRAGINLNGNSFFSQGGGMVTSNNGFATAGIWSPSYTGVYVR